MAREDKTTKNSGEIWLKKKKKKEEPLLKKSDTNGFVIVGGRRLFKSDENILSYMQNCGM